MNPYLEVMRPGLCLMSIIIPLSLFLHFGFIDIKQILFTILSIFFINLSMSLINEYMDKDTDSFIKPYKPIPSGKVNLKVISNIIDLSLIFGILFLIILSIQYGYVYIIFGILAVVSGFIYNFFRERTLLGNISLGLSYLFAILLCTYPNEYGIFIGIIFSILTITYNIAVQIEDYVGDLKAGLKTFPIKYGIFTSRIFGILLSIIGLIMSFYINIFFILSFIMVIISYIINKKELYNILLRKITRILMVLGFLYLVIR